MLLERAIRAVRPTCMETIAVSACGHRMRIRADRGPGAVGPAKAIGDPGRVIPTAAVIGPTDVGVTELVADVHRGRGVVDRMDLGREATGWLVPREQRVAAVIANRHRADRG